MTPAVAYGSAESRLGETFTALGIADRINVMTKFGQEDLLSPDAALSATRACLLRLKILRLSAVYAHAFSAVATDAREATLKAFTELKATALVDRVGVSVYSAEEALQALRLEPIDIVQMPLNVFDRQAITEGVIKLAKKSGKTIYFRSIFLQGLLTLSPSELPPEMVFASEFIKRWQKICLAQNVTPKTAALHIANHLAGEMPLVIGCEKAIQLKENIEALAEDIQDIEALVHDSAVLAEEAPENLRNPSKWPRG